jgi:hypothetical protein
MKKLVDARLRWTLRTFATASEIAVEPARGRVLARGPRQPDLKVVLAASRFRWRYARQIADGGQSP